VGTPIGRAFGTIGSGEIGRCDSLIREASIHAGGLVAVARNPVRASWLARHAAVGAIKFALNLGIAYWSP